MSYALKKRIVDLARQQDRSMAQMVRLLLNVALPVMEGISQAETMMLHECIRISQGRGVRSDKAKRPESSGSLGP
jgi:hypothetical protein